MSQYSLAYLLDIRKTISTLQEKLKQQAWDSFRQDEFNMWGLSKGFEIIGEAAHHIAPELKQQMPSINWRWLENVRNVSVHEFYGN